MTCPRTFGQKQYPTCRQSHAKTTTVMPQDSLELQRKMTVNTSHRNHRSTSKRTTNDRPNGTITMIMNAATNVISLVHRLILQVARNSNLGSVFDMSRQRLAHLVSRNFDSRVDHLHKAPHPHNLVPSTKLTAGRTKTPKSSCIHPGPISTPRDHLKTDQPPSVREVARLPPVQSIPVPVGWAQHLLYAAQKSPEGRSRGCKGSRTFTESACVVNLIRSNRKLSVKTLCKRSR